MCAELWQTLSSLCTLRHQKLSSDSFHGNLNGFIKTVLRLFEMPKHSTGLCLTGGGACCPGSLQVQGTAVDSPLACCCFKYCFFFFQFSLTHCPNDTRDHLRRATLTRV